MSVRMLMPVKEILPLCGVLYLCIIQFLSYLFWIPKVDVVQQIYCMYSVQIITEDTVNDSFHRSQWSQVDQLYTAGTGGISQRSLNNH